jgi:hypothetical protein
MRAYAGGEDEPGLDAAEHGEQREQHTDARPPAVAAAVVHALRPRREAEDGEQLRLHDERRRELAHDRIRAQGCGTEPPHKSAPRSS